MKDTQNKMSYEDQRRTSVGIWAARIFAVIALLLLGFAINLVITQGYSDWGDKLFVVMLMVILLGNLFSITVIKKPGKYALGAGILFALNLSLPTAAGVVIADFGAIAFSFVAVFSFVMLQWVLPKTSRRWNIVSIAVSAIIIVLSDLLNFSFQRPSSGLENVAPIITIVMAIAFTMHILQRSSRGRIRTKILIGFAVVAIVGGVFAFVGSQFAIGGITDNALPSLEALGDLRQAVRSVQSEALEFVAASEPDSISEFYRKESELNSAVKEIEGLANSLDRPDIFANLNSTVDEMILVGESIIQSHQKTLGFLEDTIAHQERANLARKNAETILNAEIDTHITNDNLNALSEEIIPAKDALSDFMSLVNILSRESQAFVASGNEESLEEFARTTIELAAARSKLVSSLEHISGQDDLIEELQEIEFKSLSIGQEIIITHTKTLGALEHLEEIEDELEENLLEVETLADDGVQFGLQIVTTYTIATSLVAIIVSILIGFFITRIITTPLSHLLEATQELEAGNLSARANLRPGDEFGSLANAFNGMATQLGEMLTSLEDQVLSRTTALEQRSSYLESAASVSQTIASFTKPEDIINEAVEVIQKHFEFYYVGLFMTDSTQKWAVLQAGTGLAGETMLERGHRIRIGEGMIGWSIANAKARIALDVGDDAIRFDNLDLPETRSEVALPLRSRGRVLGALTVQSAEEAAFNHDIMATLQTMADQVATSLDNAELFAKSEAALAAERKAYGEMNREDWIALVQRQASPRFVADSSSPTARPLDIDPSPEIIEAIREGNFIQDEGKTMLVPLMSRGLILGGIKLRKHAGDGVWTKAQLALTETLSGQLGIALESARLFDQSQRRAAREHIIGNASAKMRETLDIESVLQAATQELHKALGQVETEIWLDAE